MKTLFELQLTSAFRCKSLISIFVFAASLSFVGCNEVIDIGKAPADTNGGTDSSQNDSDSSSGDQTGGVVPLDPNEDDDADGILNGDDQCLVSPINEIIDDQGCSLSQIDSDDDGLKDDVDTCDNTPPGEMVDTRGCGTSTQNLVVTSGFIELDGLLVIELESTDYPSGWHLETGHMASGNAYIVWQGGDKFGQPGHGEITIPITINNPGIYRFDWRTLVTEGTRATEANDSWLKILADKFYGQKNGTSLVVCPKGKPASNGCVGADPEGASSGGWLKVYRSGGPVDEWKWNAGTNDNDKYYVFAEFDTAGVYTLSISGRSNWHGLDRLVLYRQDNASNNVDASVATNIATPESARVP